MLLTQQSLQSVVRNLGSDRQRSLQGLLLVSRASCSALTLPSCAFAASHSLARARASETVLDGDTSSKQHSACSVSSAAYCAAESSKSVLSAILKATNSAGVSALTGESQNDRQQGAVSNGTTDLVRDNGPALDAVSCGCGWDLGTQADAEGAIRRDAKHCSVCGLVGGAKRKRGPVRVGNSPLLITATGRSSGNGSTLLKI